MSGICSKHRGHDPDCHMCNTEKGFDDLVDAMQTEASKKGVEDLFKMSSKELGEAAVKAAHSCISCGKGTVLPIRTCSHCGEQWTNLAKARELDKAAARTRLLEMADKAGIKN